MKHDRKGRSKGATQPFVQVLKPTLRESAWMALPFGARCLYIALKARWNGHNNGELYLGVREGAKELGASKASIERWFHALVEHGFIRKTRGAFLGLNGNAQATRWRLTEVGYMNQQPTKDYQHWQPIEQTKPCPQNKDGVSSQLGQGCPKNEDRCPKNEDGSGTKSTIKRPHCADSIRITMPTAGSASTSDQSAPPDKPLHVLVEQRRKQLGLSKSALAERTGVSRSTLNNILVGRFGAGPDARAKLQAWLDGIEAQAA